MGKIFAIVLLALPLSAQMTPTTSQYSKLAKDKNVILKTQTDIAKLQAKQSFLFLRMMQHCRETVVSNHWAADTQCDPNTLVFSEHPAPPPQAPAAPAQPAKPEAKDAPPKN